MASDTQSQSPRGFLDDIVAFFATRFLVRESSLWRVMGLLRPMRRRIVLANLALAAATAATGFGLVALHPFFEFAMAARTADGRAVVATSPDPSSPDEPSPGAIPSDPNSSGAVASRLSAAERVPVAGDALRWARDRRAALERWAGASFERYVAVYSVFLLTLFSLTGLLQFLGDRTMFNVSIDVTSDMLRRVYGNVLRQESAFFDNTPTGSLLNVCYREVFQLNQLVKLLASTRIMQPANMVILFVALFFISVPLSLLLAALLPLVVLPTMLLTRRLKASLGRELDEESAAMDAMTEGLHGIRAIKVYGAERFELKRLEAPVRAYIESTRRRRTAQALVGPVVDTLNMFVLLAVFVVAVFSFAGRGGIEPARMVVFMFAITRFYKPFRTIMAMNVEMQRSNAVAKRIFRLLDREPEIADAPDAVDFPDRWDAIRFEDVHLTYRVRRRGEIKRRRVFLGADMTVARGEAVAIVGPNGAGKSSIAHLLCRLYVPFQGAIRVGDVPLDRIRAASLREKICLISQQPALFDRSIAENIAFGLEGVSRERIVAAAKAVRAHEFVEAMPDGYESSPGEQGRLLSGGERQKIALARALVRDPALLIFDEPTTGLDREATREFIELLARLRREERTILYITHERSQLELFDRIYRVTPDKKLAEVGIAELGELDAATG